MQNVGVMHAGGVQRTVGRLRERRVSPPDTHTLSDADILNFGCHHIVEGSRLGEVTSVERLLGNANHFVARVAHGQGPNADKNAVS